LDDSDPSQNVLKSYETYKFYSNTRHMRKREFTIQAKWNINKSKSYKDCEFIDCTTFLTHGENSASLLV